MATVQTYSGNSAFFSLGARSSRRHEACGECSPHLHDGSARQDVEEFMGVVFVMTDPEAKLYRKADGREAKLSYLGHALMENRNGLAVGGMVTQAALMRIVLA
jgi:hypothetical protein